MGVVERRWGHVLGCGGWMGTRTVVWVLWFFSVPSSSGGDFQRHFSKSRRATECKMSARKRPSIGNPRIFLLFLSKTHSDEKKRFSLLSQFQGVCACVMWADPVCLRVGLSANFYLAIPFAYNASREECI